MKFLVDENIRTDITAFLQSQGHDVASVLPRSSDRAVSEQAKRQRRVLITHDADFARTLEFPPRSYSGIIILRIHPPRYETISSVLEKFLRSRNAKTLRGKTFILSPHDTWEIV